jgi:hypothetical protein
MKTTRETAWTPGPWRIGNHFSVVCDTTAGRARDERAREFYGGELICESVTEPNARLIAKAPELCQVLKQFCSLFDRGGNLLELREDQLAATLETAEQVILEIEA